MVGEMERCPHSILTVTEGRACRQDECLLVSWDCLLVPSVHTVPRIQRNFPFYISTLTLSPCDVRPHFHEGRRPSKASLTSVYSDY